MKKLVKKEMEAVAGGYVGIGLDAAPRGRDKHACDVLPQWMRVAYPNVCERYYKSQYGKD